MRRAIAGVGIVLALSLFLVLAPVVPTSAKESSSTYSPGYQPCPLHMNGCFLTGASATGYGSVTYTMFGRGGTCFDGTYQIATSNNFTVSLSA